MTSMHNSRPQYNNRFAHMNFSAEVHTYLNEACKKIEGLGASLRLSPNDAPDLGDPCRVDRFIELQVDTPERRIFAYTHCIKLDGNWYDVHIENPKSPWGLVENEQKALDLLGFKGMKKALADEDPGIYLSYELSTLYTRFGLKF